MYTSDNSDNHGLEVSIRLLYYNIPFIFRKIKFEIILSYIDNIK